VRPGAHKLAVINAVGPEQHREDQRHHLAARVRGNRTITAQPHKLADKSLDPEPPGERRHERDPGVADEPLIVEGYLDGAHPSAASSPHHSVTS
jgi:hypothetical protein